MDSDSPRVDHNKPPFSRLFVVCSKYHTESDIQEAFQEYGHVEDLWLVKDRNTKASKGIAYVKFSKASEAALAMENLHGKAIGNDSKPIKALLSDSKGSSNKSDPVAQLALNEEKHRSRIFILIPKSMTEDEVKEEFSQYGDINHVQILVDRETKESKGCAYVRFDKPYQAFKALEDCDKFYKAVMAEPRVPKNMMTSQSNVDSYGGYKNLTGREVKVSCPVPPGYPDIHETGATNKLTISCYAGITERQLTRLCDVCPGFTKLEMSPVSRQENRATVYYTTPGHATYAKRKLHNLEYPPGNWLSVKFYDNVQQQQQRSYSQAPIQQPLLGYGPDDYQNYSGYTGYDQGQGGYDQDYYMQPASNCAYTNVALPAHQPTATSTVCRGKLFFVTAPDPVSKDVLFDVFCRFADLIEIQVVQGTVYGYIKYGLKESADAAKILLDGATVAGNTIRLTVPENSNDAKRIKLDR